MSFIFGQETIKIEEKNMKMSQGVQNGLAIFIPAADIKLVEKEWKRKIKSLKGKTNKVKDDITAMGISMYNISDNSINIYMNCKNGLNGTQVNLFFDLGESYLSSYLHSDPYKSADRFCYNFALETAKIAYSAKVEEADKTYKKTSDELKYLKSSFDRLERNIDKWSQQITKAENEMSDNKKAQSNKLELLSSQEYDLKKAQENLKKIK
jgi:DNA repair exonuclease SbcCD ATPase subunit